MRSARDSFYRRRFSELEGDGARLWRFTKRACGKGSAGVELPTSLISERGDLRQAGEIADHLNQHFASVGERYNADLQIYKNIETELLNVWRSDVEPIKLCAIEVPDTLLAMKATSADWRVGWFDQRQRLFPRGPTDPLVQPVTDDR